MLTSSIPDSIYAAALRFETVRMPSNKNEVKQLTYSFPHHNSFKVRNHRKAVASSRSDQKAVRVQLAGGTGSMKMYNGMHAILHVHTSMAITPTEVLLHNWIVLANENRRHGTYFLPLRC